MPTPPAVHNRAAQAGVGAALVAEEVEAGAAAELGDDDIKCTVQESGQ